MNFIPIEFIIFLSVVFALYWSCFKKSATSQNLLLTAASLFFYGWVDFRFLSLLFVSILFNFFIGRGIYHQKAAIGRRLLCLGLLCNIGILIYFKYVNFFRESFMTFFGSHAGDSPYTPLNIVLPLGISFYTFQAIGYIIDIYNEDSNPAPGLLSFATFMTFFPKITAGPIERAERFLPQIEKRRIFDYDQAVDGLRQILWGLFIKLVIANNCGSIVDPIFENYLHLTPGVLLTGAFFFTFQLYCDFSGYSNIALGISRLFGIRLTRNFATPFFSTHIRDFWRRWHISLSSWMMHYIFSPLSFTLRKYRKTGLIAAIMTTFLVIGLWHGANWTFIVFGALHGLYFIPSIIAGNSSKPPLPDNGRPLPSPEQCFSMTRLFLLVMLTMIFFRADTVPQAVHYITRLFSLSAPSEPGIPLQNGTLKALVTFLLILLFTAVEWAQRDKDHDLQIDHIKSRWVKTGIYYMIVISIFLLGSISDMNFIYSQF